MKDTNFRVTTKDISNYDQNYTFKPKINEKSNKLANLHKDFSKKYLKKD